MTVGWLAGWADGRASLAGWADVQAWPADGRASLAGWADVRTDGRADGRTGGRAGGLLTVNPRPLSTYPPPTIQQTVLREMFSMPTIKLGTVLHPLP